MKQSVFKLQDISYSYEGAQRVEDALQDMNLQAYRNRFYGRLHVAWALHRRAP